MNNKDSKQDSPGDQMINKAVKSFYIISQRIKGKTKVFMPKVLFKEACIKGCESFRKHTK